MTWFIVKKLQEMKRVCNWIRGATLFVAILREHCRDRDKRVIGLRPTSGLIGCFLLFVMLNVTR